MPSACSTIPKPPRVPTTRCTCSGASSTSWGQSRERPGETWLACSPRASKQRASMAERKIHFVSLGCVKNRVDTEVMLGVAGRDGWSIVDEAEEAEVIVVNTCGFIG